MTETHKAAVEALEPCPFCKDGGKPWFNPHTNESSDNGSRIAMVGCSVCGVTLKAANFPQMDGTWKLTKDIVAIWNTRALKQPSSVEVTEREFYERMAKVGYLAIDGLNLHEAITAAFPNNLRITRAAATDGVKG